MTFCCKKVTFENRLKETVDCLKYNFCRKNWKNDILLQKSDIRKQVEGNSRLSKILLHFRSALLTLLLSQLCLPIIVFCKAKHPQKKKRRRSGEKEKQIIRRKRKGAPFLAFVWLQSPQWWWELTSLLAETSHKPHNFVIKPARLINFQLRSDYWRRPVYWVGHIEEAGLSEEKAKQQEQMRRKHHLHQKTNFFWWDFYFPHIWTHFSCQLGFYLWHMGVKCIH